MKRARNPMCSVNLNHEVETGPVQEIDSPPSIAQFRHVIS